MAAVPEICPRCARNEATTPAGFCESCTVERAAEMYASDDRLLAIARSTAWVDRAARSKASDNALATRLRQQRHRLLEATRPRAPAPAGTDPLALAAEAVSKLQTIKMALGSKPAARMVDDVMEEVRQLAWGPDPCPQNVRTRPSKGAKQRQLLSK